MVIKECGRCGHTDTQHIVDEATNGRTAQGRGSCYHCDCKVFRERVQFVQIISHMYSPDEDGLLMGLDAEGRVWWYDEDVKEWALFGDGEDAFRFGPRVQLVDDDEVAVSPKELTDGNV